MTKDNYRNSAFIECGSQSGRFNISDITFAMIKDLRFRGCGGNTVVQIEQFILEHVIFLSIGNGLPTLLLNDVSTAKN